MKCIFISNVLDENFINEHNVNTISYADNMAQLELIQRLKEIYKENLIVLTAAYNDFQKFNHKEEVIYARNIELLAVKNCSKNKIIYYLTIIKGYYEKLHYYLELYKEEKIIVITNGPHIFRTFPILLTKNKYNYKFVPFLLGAVELIEFKGILSLIASFSKKILKYADGSINYVEANSTQYTDKPYVTILYSISEKDKELSNKFYVKNKKVGKQKTILFAGALNDINALKDLIKVIKKAPNNYKFIVCGDGVYKEELKALEENYPQKLTFLGKVSHEKVVELEHSSDYLIVLRDTKTDMGKHHSKYSLSSKLSEYLLSGTPVIVNKHEAIPKELKKYLNIIDDSEYQTVLGFLEKEKKNAAEQQKKAMEGRTFIIENANYKVQGDKVVEFLKKIS